ncbi:MAG: hypothetical protein FWE27_00440 [Defluviitaleaceae bacterium]|nr:hypothetical protein [Defluviitaleaceae bacterium]
MSIQHEPITVKPISEVAKFKKNLIPTNIPDTYALNPMFEIIASEENIRKGVIAFRDFLYLFFDRLISDGHLYAKPPKKPSSMADYPFLHNITNILVEIGYYSKPAEGGDSLLITEIPSCTVSTEENGKIKKPKIPFSNLIECLRFLTLCGFGFNSFDLESKTLNISEAQPLEISYPNDPILLTGLRALSVADMELRTGRRYWNDNNLLRCDYRLLQAEDTDILDVLKDFLNPLPEKIQEFAVKLHQRYTDVGMTCVTIIDGQYHFAYSHIKNSRRTLSSRDIYQLRVWEFAYSIKNGYCLFVRAKKTDKYTDIIEKFPSYLQEKIAKGYGCDRKLRNERCQGGCQGICIPLDDSILNISEDIEIWLDNEVPSSLRK